MVFDAPRNVGVFTVQQLIKGSAPILQVCHDAEDGASQFLTGLDIDPNDMKLVSLESIVRLDPPVETLADLPEGYVATRRVEARPRVPPTSPPPSPATPSDGSGINHRETKQPSAALANARLTRANPHSARSDSASASVGLVNAISTPRVAKDTKQRGSAAFAMLPLATSTWSKAITPWRRGSSRPRIR